MQTELILIIPEITLFAMACLVLIVDAFSKDPLRRVSYWLTQASLLLVFVLIYMSFPKEVQLIFNDSIVIDQMGSLLKMFMCLITLVVFIYSYEYLKNVESIKGEYFVLGLFAVLGMMVMASSYSLLSVYLGLELLSLSLYAIVAMHRNSKLASEAAIKYFVLGAIASGMLLYGISIIYGVSGSIQLANISDSIKLDAINTNYFVFGMVFMIIGISFKLGIAPFHMWAPDVYQGSPAYVTLFISTAPKLAAFALAFRILIDGLFPLIDDWQPILILLSVLSISIGNVIAISQTNIKRMLAYSMVAHMGYLLLGFIAGTNFGFSGALFYVISYALMSMGTFGIIILLSSSNAEQELLENFKGLSQRMPWFSFIMLCLMFSMAGIPPFLGFWSKWFVLKELVDSGFVMLTAIAVIFSVIGAYYYLRIVKLMYFDSCNNDSVIPKKSKQMCVFLSLNGLLIILLGAFPDVLMKICLSVLA